MSEAFKAYADNTPPQTTVRGEVVKYGGLYQMPDSWEAYEGFASTYIQTKMVEAVREMECPEGKYLAEVWVEIDGVTEFNHVKLKAVATYVDIDEVVADEPTFTDYHYSAVEAAERILELHKAMDVEPSETLCVHCSYRLPNGRFFGNTVEWPCPTVELLGDFWG